MSGLTKLMRRFHSTRYPSDFEVPSETYFTPVDNPASRQVQLHNPPLCAVYVEGIVEISYHISGLRSLLCLSLSGSGCSSEISINISGCTPASCHSADNCGSAGCHVTTTPDSILAGSPCGLVSSYGAPLGEFKSSSC